MRIAVPPPPTAMDVVIRIGADNPGGRIG